jgi:hypothetical protein
MVLRTRQASLSSKDRIPVGAVKNLEFMAQFGQLDVPDVRGRDDCGMGLSD